MTREPGPLGWIFLNRPQANHFCFWILNFWHPARFSPWLAAFQQACLWLSLSFHFSQQLKTGFSADAAVARASWSLYNPTAGVLDWPNVQSVCGFFSKPWPAVYVSLCFTTTKGLLIHPVEDFIFIYEKDFVIRHGLLCYEREAMDKHDVSTQKGEGSAESWLGCSSAENSSRHQCYDMSK